MLYTSSSLILWKLVRLRAANKISYLNKRSFWPLGVEVKWLTKIYWRLEQKSFEPCYGHNVIQKNLGMVWTQQFTAWANNAVHLHLLKSFLVCAYDMWAMSSIPTRRFCHRHKRINRSEKNQIFIDWSCINLRRRVKSVGAKDCAKFCSSSRFIRKVWQHFVNNFGPEKNVANVRSQFTTQL